MTSYLTTRDYYHCHRQPKKLEHTFGRLKPQLTEMRVCLRTISCQKRTLFQYHGKLPRPFLLLNLSPALPDHPTCLNWRSHQIEGASVKGSWSILTIRLSFSERVSPRFRHSSPPLISVRAAPKCRARSLLARSYTEKFESSGSSRHSL